MNPVLLLCAMAFAGDDSPSAAPILSGDAGWPAPLSTGAAPATAETAPAAASTGDAPPARRSGRTGRTGRTSRGVSSATDAAEVPAQAAPAAPVATTPAADPTAFIGPVPAPATTDTLLVTAPLAPAVTTASVLDTMPTPAPVLDTMSNESPVPASGWAWPALLSGAGLIAAWQLRKRALAAAPSTLKVVQRHALGEKSSLLVVDVEDGQGVSRRLLVGSGANGLNLIQDLGLVPAAAPAPGLDDYEAHEVSAPRAEVFANLLDEVLVERGVAPIAAVVDTEEPRPARFFAPEDLAPEAVPVVATNRGTRRRAQLRGRFHTPHAEWTPTVDAYLPPPPDVVAPHDATVEPVVEPVFRGAAALIARAPTLPAGARKSGLSALVKGYKPEPAAQATPAPSLVVLPNLPEAAPTEAIAPAMISLAGSSITLPPDRDDDTVTATADTSSALEAPALETPATPSRAVYISPTMSQPVSRPDRRIVGPPLRDARLTTPSTAPRLRLADPKSRPAAEEPIPPVHELVERLIAQNAEPQKLAVNGNVSPTPPSRADGLKRRFEAIAARESSR